MNKFLTFVLFTLFIQYAISETKTKAKSSRAKKEDVDPAIVASTAYGSSSSESYNAVLDDSTITPAPVNILNTPTTSSYYQNPLFRSNEGAYNQYNLNSKSHLTNYRAGALNDGAYRPDNYNQYYQNNPYNFNQGKYYSGNNYPGHLNYNEDGSYKYDAYSHSAYNSKTPNQDSGIYYPYQQPLSSGYYSGNQGYYDQGIYQGGINSKESSSKTVGSSSITSTPAPISSTISSTGISSGSSGGVGSGIYTAGSYKSGYNSGFPGYAGYYNNQNKPYSTGSYDYTKYNYPGYQSGAYYGQGYSAIGSGIVTPSTSKSSTSSFTSTKSTINSGALATGEIKPNLQGQYNPISSSYPYNYPGYTNYQTGAYDSGAYNYQGYDYSKLNNPSYQLNKAYDGKYTSTYNSNIFPKTTTTSKTGQSSSSFSSGISGTSVNSAGISSFGQAKPVASLGSYNYPGYTNYQSGTYDYNTYPGYAGYSGYQVDKTSEVKYTPGYNAYGSAVTSAPVTPTSYPSISSSLKSTINPLITKNKVSSTLISSTTPSYTTGQYNYQSGLPGSNYAYSGFPGHQSGYYEDGSYKQNYNTNQYSKGSFYQNSGAFGQGYKYPNLLTGTSSPATPLVSSGIGSSTASYTDSNAYNKVNSGSTGSSLGSGNVQSSYSGSYDFSAYGKKTPSVISTTSTINPSYYNYPGYQTHLSGNSGYYQQSGLNYPGYNVAGYHGSSYKSGAVIPSNITGSNYYLGSFAQDGIYNPSFNTQQLGYSSYFSGHNPADYQTGHYHAGRYVQDGLHHTFPGHLSSHVASDYHEGFPTTVSPVTSTETSKTK